VSTDLALVDLGQQDAAAGVLLSVEAGWNQTIDDWRLMIALGRAIGLREPGGALAASALLLPYESGFAWLSMVLVTERRRRQGLARRLTEVCLERARAAGQEVLLDATPLGEAVYTPLGFEVVFPFRRWIAEEPASPVADRPALRPMTAADLDAVAAYDAVVFGSERGPLLRGLHARSGPRAAVLADGRGYVLARDGRVMTQIGPLVADEPAGAAKLLRHAIACESGPLCIDLPTRHDALGPLLEAAGFTPRRTFNRMRLKSTASPGDPGRYVAIAGPELG
jgi:GNAT superfamily N-acetyltransferase